MNPVDQARTARAQMRIDLHAHSNASDGSDSAADLVEIAYAAGLDVVALTDHDTVDGYVEATAAVRRLAGAAARRRFGLMPGIELSCLAGDVSLHLLGYLFDPTYPALVAELELLRTDRVRRARSMVDKLVELGAPVSWPQVVRIAGAGAVGRPHVAQALVDAGVVPDIASAFTPEWISNDGRAYVEKYSLLPERGIELVRAAGGVTVFAHPAASARGQVVDESAIERFAAAGLDGIEVDHPDHDEAARERLREIAASLDLLVTGSSDYHGTVKSTPIGAETTDRVVYGELVARASGNSVVST